MVVCPCTVVSFQIQLRHTITKKLLSQGSQMQMQKVHLGGFCHIWCMILRQEVRRISHASCLDNDDKVATIPEVFDAGDVVAVHMFVLG